MFVLISFDGLCEDNLLGIDCSCFFNYAGITYSVVNNRYYCYIIWNDACMNLLRLNFFKSRKGLYTVHLSVSVDNKF